MTKRVDEPNETALTLRKMHKRDTFTCAVCGKTYEAEVAVKAGERTCSVKCRVAAHRARAKLARRAPENGT